MSLTLPDVGTPPTADVDAGAVDRAAKIEDPKPVPAPVTTGRENPHAAPVPAPKRKRGQRGPDKQPRRSKKASPADYLTAKAGGTPGAPSLVTPLPPAPPSPDAVARLARGLAQLAGMVGAVAASSYDVAKLTPDEAQALGDSWAEILAPYMATDGAGESLKWITAGAVTLGVVLPRVKEAKTRKVQRAAPVEVTVTETATGPVYSSGPIIDSATQK